MAKTANIIDHAYEAHSYYPDWSAHEARTQAKPYAFISSNSSTFIFKYSNSE